MQNSFGYLFLFIFWVCGFIVIKLWNKKEANTGASFLLSNRNVGFFLGAITTAAAWIWAPALFVASQKAFEQGVPGLFWFSFPNVMALVLFSFLASRIKKIFNYGYTLPEYMRIRFDKKMQIIYMIAIFIIQTYSVILQVTAALLLLNLITGINKTVLVVILGIIIISLSLFKGFRSSLAIDTIKAAFIAIVGFIIVPWTIDQNGGLSNIIHGVSGISGNFSNIFNMKVALAFGIPISVSLLSGIVVDQQQWQRAFAMKNNTVRRSFLLGAVLFSFVPLLLGVLGFAAAGSNVVIDAGQTQLAGVLLVKNYLPQVGVYIFSFMVLAGLVAAGISALSAASSVGVIDLFHLFKKDVSDKKIILISRITMIIILLIAVSIALIPNIQLVYLVLLIGVFRAALMIPTILSLYWPKLSTNFTFSGIVLGMLIGMPLFIYGSVTKNSFISSFGSLMPIIVSTIFCVLGVIFKPANFDYEKLK
jgi:Na+/proline symporter